MRPWVARKSSGWASMFSRARMRTARLEKLVLLNLPLAGDGDKNQQHLFERVLKRWLLPSISSMRKA